MSAGPGAVPHHDVASYALGVLDEADATRFEEHLAQCDPCARELESFLPVVDLLSDVRPPALDLPPPPPEVPGDELGRRRARRSRRSGSRAAAGPARLAGLPSRLAGSAQSALRRPAVAAAVAAVVATGVTAGVTGTFGPARPPTEAAPTASPGSSAAASVWDDLRGPDLANGQKLSATDPGTGVRAELVLDRAAWGTRVTFALSHVTGPQTCRLVALRRGGGTEVLSSWLVPAAGYGTPGQPRPLVLQAATALRRADIAGVRVESVTGSGSRDLVTIRA